MYIPCIWQNVVSLFIAANKLPSLHSRSLGPKMNGKMPIVAVDNIV